MGKGGLGRGGGNRCRGRGETRVKKTLPIICCTNARAKLLVFNLASPRVIGWKWGREKKKREKEKNVILSLSLFLLLIPSLFSFFCRNISESNNGRETKDQPFELKLHSPPLFDLKRYSTGRI